VHFLPVCISVFAHVVELLLARWTLKEGVARAFFKKIQSLSAVPHVSSVYLNCCRYVHQLRSSAISLSMLSWMVLCPQISGCIDPTMVERMLDARNRHGHCTATAMFTAMVHQDSRKPERKRFGITRTWWAVITNTTDGCWENGKANVAPQNSRQATLRRLVSVYAIASSTPPSVQSKSPLIKSCLYISLRAY